MFFFFFLEICNHGPVEIPEKSYICIKMYSSPSFMKPIHSAINRRKMPKHLVPRVVRNRSALDRGQGGSSSPWRPGSRNQPGVEGWLVQQYFPSHPLSPPPPLVRHQELSRNAHKCQKQSIRKTSGSENSHNEKEISIVSSYIPVTIKNINL